MRRLLELGVYVFGRYNVLLITPPLIVAKDDLEFGFEALERALGEIELPA